jgi:hypothetical protein
MSEEDELDSETRKQRVNRELIELLNELRVALPGVQVLFAFLLTVPFSQRFAQASDFQRDAYVVSLVAAAVATILLVAPAAQHRVLFRQRDKEKLLKRASRYAYLGILTLAVATSSAVVLVIDNLFGRGQAYVIAGGVLALSLWWWVAIPVAQRIREPERDERRAP